MSRKRQTATPPSSEEEIEPSAGDYQSSGDSFKPNGSDDSNAEQPIEGLYYKFSGSKSVYYSSDQHDRARGRSRTARPHQRHGSRPPSSKRPRRYLDPVQVSATDVSPQMNDPNQGQSPSVSTDPSLAQHTPGLNEQIMTRTQVKKHTLTPQ